MSDASLPEFPPVPGPPERKRPSVGLITLLVFGSVALLCGLCVAAGFIGTAVIRRDNDWFAAGPPVAAVSAAAPAPETSRNPTGPSPAPPPSGTGFGDGTWLVGSDVEPGDYKARVPADSVGCYWARLASTDGTSDAILANGLSQPGAQAVVTIRGGDKAFQTQGCGTWTKI